MEGLDSTELNAKSSTTRWYAATTGTLGECNALSIPVLQRNLAAATLIQLRVIGRYVARSGPSCVLSLSCRPRYSRDALECLRGITQAVLSRGELEPNVPCKIRHHAVNRTRLRALSML